MSIISTNNTFKKLELKGIWAIENVGKTFTKMHYLIKPLRNDRSRHQIIGQTLRFDSRLGVKNIDYK